MIEIKADRHKTELVRHGCRRTLMREFTKICRVFAESIAEGAKTDADRHHMMFEALRAANEGIRAGFGGVKENDRTES